MSRVYLQKKKIAGPVVFPSEYRSDKLPMSDIPIVAHKDKHSDAYAGACQDDEFIYLTYIGEFYETQEKENSTVSYIYSN